MRCVFRIPFLKHSTRTLETFHELQQDAVYALRALRRNTAFTVAIVGALAIGIAADTTLFTLIDAVMLRTLPVPHAEQSSPSAIRRSLAGVGTARSRRTSRRIRCTKTSAVALRFSPACSRPA